VHPARGLPADIELTGVIADDDGLGQKAVCLYTGPERAFRGDPHRVLNDRQTGFDAGRDAQLIEMRRPRLLVGEVRVGRPGQKASGYNLRAKVEANEAS
jgi:hypothetical protein